MLNFDIIALLVLITFLSIFLYKKREDVDVTGKFPFFYAVMYRAKWGINFMKNFAEKHKKLLNIVQYISITVGLLSMLFISIHLIYMTIDMLLQPDVVVPAAGVILPVETSWSFYVPFMYFIISITYLMIVHEGMHGIFMKYFGLKIKNTGFAFFSLLVPILPGAFVEPDEEELEKAPLKDRLAVLSGGSFANIVSAALFLLISFLLVTATDPLTYDEVRISNIMEDTPAYHANVSQSTLYGMTYNDTYNELNDFEYFLSLTESLKPNQSITLHTDETNKTFTLTSHPEDSNRGYMGMNFESEQKLKEQFSNYQIPFAALNWIMGLFFWLFVINFGVGLMNLVPLGPLDGGLMLKSILDDYFNLDENKSNAILSIISLLFIAILAFHIILVPAFF